MVHQVQLEMDSKCWMNRKLDDNEGALSILHILSSTLTENLQRIKRKTVSHLFS